MINTDLSIDEVGRLMPTKALASGTADAFDPKAENPANEADPMQIGNGGKVLCAGCGQPMDATACMIDPLTGNKYHSMACMEYVP